MNTRLRALLHFHDRRSIDWKLLLFLLLFLNVKLVIKFLALAIIYLLQPNLKFRLRFRHTRLPLFYPAMICIAAFDWIIYKGFTNLHQAFAFFMGACFWAACLLALHQLRIFTDKIKPEIICQTLVVFFIINALVSYGTLFKILLETGSLNPYRYQGNFQEYFISTGDYIKGISLDTSVTNAALNAMGVVFFLFRRRMPMVLLCMSVLLLTASNLTNILLFAVLLYVFIFDSDRDQKSMITVCLFLLVVFLVKVSPQNNQYIAEIYGRLTGHEIKPAAAASFTSGHLEGVEAERQAIARHYLDSLGRQAEQKATMAIASQAAPGNQETRPVIPVPNIHTKPYQHRDDTNATRKKLLGYIQDHNLATVNTARSAGKLVAARQTFDFFRDHPAQLLTGHGMGRFSSKLAFRSSALGIAGSYPAGLSYTDPVFVQKHLSVYLSFFSSPARLHSVVNSPNSVYLQLAGEYGLAGLVAFAFWYLGFFIRRLRRKGYGLPLLLLAAGFLSTDYWFEQLSIMVFFELLFLLYARENPVPHA